MKWVCNIDQSFLAKIKRKYNGKNGNKRKPVASESCIRCKLPVTFAEDKYVLSTMAWYWPRLSGTDAEHILNSEPNGTFLVRRSSTPGFMFTVTYKVEGQVGNLRVHCKDGLFCLSFQDPLQPKEPTLQRLIIELVSQSKNHSSVCGLRRESNGEPTTVPLKLDKPFKRNITLQDQCRKVIMRSIEGPEYVPQLNITENMKTFLLELGDED